MSGNREMITEMAGNRHITVSDRANGRNGHKRSPGLLSWYWAQPRVKGVSYVLTANGYVILPTGFPRSRRGLDMDEMME